MTRKSAGLLIRILTALVTWLCCAATGAEDFSKISGCPRPEPGSVAGSCAVRKYPELTEKSPYAPLKWMACLQNALHLPSGGYGDAVFFSDLVPEWEKEIGANLRSLETVLSERDQKVLKEEQRAWEAARKMAAEKRAKEPSQEGTMYLMFGAAVEMSYPEDRAIELACRIEKLTSK